jgi:hypothetical protein
MAPISAAIVNIFLYPERSAHGTNAIGPEENSDYLGIILSELIG